MNAIKLPLHGPSTSTATKLLNRYARSPESAKHESELLKSIRIALRGIDTDASTIHSTICVSEELPWDEEELTWNAHTVTLSCGGVMYKKWNFEEEGQCVQWACSGCLEQTSTKASWSSQSAAHYTSTSEELPVPPIDVSQRPTFGPFSQAHQPSKQEKDQATRYPATFVFLRSIGKIFLKNGLDYTFSLPFIVRKAWPLFPHGVIIQRVLEPTELVESETTGDAVLPTIFSLTTPFAEPAAIGLTDRIFGGFKGILPSLRDEEEDATRPLRSIPPAEMIIWVSQKVPTTNDDVLVTVDPERRQLSIWRYVYIKPKDTPVPIGRNKSQNTSRKRQSLTRTKPLFCESSETERMHPLASRVRLGEQLPISVLPELPPHPPAQPWMPPSLSTTATLAALVAGPSSLPQLLIPQKGRRNTLTRNDISVTMDRMVLGGRIDGDSSSASIEHGRMKAAFWVEKLHSQDISETESKSWTTISVALFDERWDGKSERSLIAVCLPVTNTLVLYSLIRAEDHTLKVARLPPQTATSIAAIRATRPQVTDLLVVRPSNKLVLLTHGLRELPVEFIHHGQIPIPNDSTMDLDVKPSDVSSNPPLLPGRIACLRDASWSSVTVCFENGSRMRTAIDLVPHEELTFQALRHLSMALPADSFFALHKMFLMIWSSRGLCVHGGVEFRSFTDALYRLYAIEDITMPPSTPVRSDPWNSLSSSQSFDHFLEDPSLRGLKTPPRPPPSSRLSRPSCKPHELLAPILHALHMLGEDMRLMVYRYESVLRLAPVICRIALLIRPEWADYWKRLCPGVACGWPSPMSTVIEYLDERLPVWPPDISAVCYGLINTLESRVHDSQMNIQFNIPVSYAFGHLEPMVNLSLLSPTFKYLGTGVEGSQKRAENAVRLMVRSQLGRECINLLPLSMSTPLREAARSCQLSPPEGWPLTAYQAIGRNDLAACARDAPDMLFRDGYRTVKQYINQPQPRPTYGNLVSEARAAGAGEVDAVSGVELDLEEFTSVRFGQDRRLEDVSRMLCSSTIPSVRLLERPELNEHDQAKEQQHQVGRIAERTLALPYGRAMFTFGSVPAVTRESYAIPKMEYTIRIQPLNTTAAPEPGKIPLECLQWGEFHNGLAAGLKISPSATGIESSWITFNKPSELTPEHAGFLYGLGLTGHLREMLTWHTFGYLTPKHDLTSIGVLLGLSAANVGSGNRHVTKLLAVHTPALLPTPAVDLNVSLMTQAAGLAGVGLLYMGTKNRRMADVCLGQISRKDLVQPDLSNEHREAYTYSAALGFGMIMLGKGSPTLADINLLSRLAVLIHGEAHSCLDRQSRPSFDINLTSPAATIALGLMYLKTERQDVADVLTIPDTVLALNYIQPSFLLLRTLARSLIMWKSVMATNEWVTAQVPQAIAAAMEARLQGKSVDDALELAYYNILAGCCFAIGLKYAGSARQDAYLIIISYFDLFSRLVYSNGPAFNHKIKRSAVREGLNLISISLGMIMAGTGELTCFRRFRYAYGMYHQAFRYGTHMATHMSLGLLFLGGGRFTLGTSDAAIACMIMAFFPRFHHVSSDNKSYLQALRHVWVLAVEPRCLTARDVDTGEVVYLPVKITTREGNGIGTQQLICPTLIPDLDKLLSIRVDTPRYWPFYLDIENLPRHKAGLLRNQTLYVKRRTAFLTYTEDPRGSRSMIVRSGSSAGDAATLDFPQLRDTKSHPASDFSEFITSFSNDVVFLAFADYFCRDDGKTQEEKIFHTYCHASLLDSILQDKPQTLQLHLTLYCYRKMISSSRYFHLRLQDLRFMSHFYGKIYDRRFSGRTENNPRPPLIRESTISGVLHALDGQFDEIRNSPQFLTAIGQYAHGEVVMVPEMPASSVNIPQLLAWYLLREDVPVSTFLVVLQGLARDAHQLCLTIPSPDSTTDADALEQGIKEVLHATGVKMTNALGLGWSVRSLDDVINAWKSVKK